MSGKRKNHRFTVGLVGVALAVTYLIWTGISETMMYYITPAELMARVEQDPTFRDMGVKMGGQLVPGSYSRVPGRRVHHFTIHDFDDPSIGVVVEFDGTLPDTFRPDDEDMEVVVEGRLRDDGVFVATTVLTKCGSRYEATDEQLGAPAAGGGYGAPDGAPGAYGGPADEPAPTASTEELDG